MSSKTKICVDAKIEEQEHIDERKVHLLLALNPKEVGYCWDSVWALNPLLLMAIFFSFLFPSFYFLIVRTER